MRQLPDRLVVASHNRGKAKEIAALLASRGVAIVSAADLGLPEPDETEATFSGNALIKSRAAAAASGLPALADDSGLAVTALGGAPGVLSARWAGPDKDFAMAMARVQDELAEAADRSATFVCALALSWPGGDDLVVEGEVTGAIVWPPRGENGFGYDPIFTPDGHSETFGEMAPDKKHAMSHRARAFAALLAALEGR